MAIITRRTILKDGVLVKEKPLGKLASSVRPSYSGMSLKDIQEVSAGRPLNIQIVRSLGGIGDVLMTTPSLKALKNRFPSCTITYVTDCKYANGALKEIVEHNPYVDKVVPVNQKDREKFDFSSDVTSTCVMLEKRNREVPNRIDAFAEQIGVDLEPTGYLPVYKVRDEERAWAKERIGRNLRRNKMPIKIGIQARSSTERRSWPLDKVRELVATLARDPMMKVFVFDYTHGVTDVERWNMHNIEPVLDFAFPQTAAMIEQMDLIVAPDSGLMHLGGAFNKKMVTLFGSTDYRARINHYPNAIAITAGVMCSPCWYARCQNGTACMKRIKVEDVYESILRQLSLPMVEAPKAKDLLSSPPVVLWTEGHMNELSKILGPDAMKMVREKIWSDRECQKK